MLGQLDFFRGSFHFRGRNSGLKLLDPLGCFIRWNFSVLVLFFSVYFVLFVVKKPLVA